MTAGSTVLEAARSQIAGTIPEAEVRNLPLNGRNFLDAALLVPGVSPTNVPATQMFPETSAVPGVGLSVSSQRNLSNNFVVDGLSANDDAAALSGITYGVDAIEQFQVVTSGGQAELGRALGGYVNIVTRSGTNARARQRLRLRARRPPQRAESPDRPDPADVAVAVRRLGRRPAAEEPHLLFHQRRAAPPGSVRAGDDRRTRPSRSSTAGWPPPAIRDHESRPASSRSPCAPPTCSARSTIRSAPAINSACATASTGVDSDNSRNAGASNAPSAATDVDNLDQMIAVSNTLMLSSRTVLETRAQLAGSDFTAPPVDLVGPAVSIAGVAVVRNELGQSSGAAQHALSGRQQPVAPDRQPRPEIRRRFHLQRRPHHLPARLPRQLQLFVAGEFSLRRLQQRRLHADVRHVRDFTRPIRISRCTPRTSGS